MGESRGPEDLPEDLPYALALALCERLDETAVRLDFWAQGASQVGWATVHACSLTGLAADLRRGAAVARALLGEPGPEEAPDIESLRKSLLGADPRRG